MTTKPRALVICSDLHCGSTVGLLHPDGVQTDDQTWVKPSPVQEWLWEQHERFVDDVREKTRGYRRHLFLNGDVTEGLHHRSHQTIAPEPGVHVQAAADVLERGLLTLRWESIHMTRGTPAHVGSAAGLEKSVAAKIAARGHPIIRDPETDSYVWPYVYADMNGTLIDVRHHGRHGQREHTRKGYSALYGQDIWQSHVVDGRRPPDIAIRSHHHRYLDSGPDHRGITRVITTPCWQLPTEWTRRISIETLPDIGGVVVLLEDDRVWVEPLLYQPAPDPQPIWSPA